VINNEPLISFNQKAWRAVVAATTARLDIASKGNIRQVLLFFTSLGCIKPKDMLYLIVVYESPA
jgi:hypothetical protein